MRDGPACLDGWRVTGTRVISGQVRISRAFNPFTNASLDGIGPFGWLNDRPGIGDPANRLACLPRKEVIQPHLPVRLPCYDFVPITNPTFDGCLLAVGPPASGVTGFHDVTGGVYKAREHIHRSVLTCGY
jgi:hypothetical protein